MASEYFTTTPEMKASVDVAAAAGNFGSYQVPVQGSNVTGLSEGTVAQCEDQVKCHQLNLCFQFLYISSPKCLQVNT
uniref:Uncharacterized protein n=1 Tax=Kalanchoe fedtschenkoi TaxID=63787 RepID=A0A7N0RA51_KALFE